MLRTGPDIWDSADDSTLLNSDVDSCCCGVHNGESGTAVVSGG